MRRLDSPPGSRARAVATIALVTIAVALAGCASAWSGKSVTEINGAMGIQPNSVPPYLLRPDGLMINGLLPAQWANEL
jgi:hypothetical protein